MPVKIEYMFDVIICKILESWYVYRLIKKVKKIRAKKFIKNCVLKTKKKQEILPETHRS